MTDEEQKPADTLAFPDSSERKIVGGMPVNEAFKGLRLSLIKAVKRCEDNGQSHQIPRLIARFNQAAKEYDQPFFEYTPNQPKR